MTSEPVRRNLDAMQELRLEATSPDFLLTWEKSLDEIHAAVLAAECLQALHQAGKSIRIFDSGVAVAIFRDKSTRTRYSFASAIDALGLSLTELDEEKSQIAHGETVRETATMISFLTETIGIRDDLYLGEGNRYMQEVAGALDAAASERTLNQRPSIVNLQCDIDHPTQTLSDLLMLKQHFGSLEALKGKKVAMSWAYSPSYGKPLSVPQGIIGLLTRLGMNVVLAAPDGYDLMPEVEKMAKEQARQSGGSFRKVPIMDEAFHEADVVYPKSWAPYEIMKRRSEALRAGDDAAFEMLEKECLARNARSADWECNEQRMAKTKDGKALYMHCLPADISGVSCERGEVSQEVFERCRAETYRQAGFKPYVIAAMVLLARSRDPVTTIAALAERNRPRLVS